MTKLMSSQNDNGEVLNISSTMKEYGLEAIGRMFLGARLGVLQGLDLFAIIGSPWPPPPKLKKRKKMTNTQNIVHIFCLL